MKTPYQLESNANISIENLGIMHCINFACYNKKEGKKTIRGPCPLHSYFPLTFPTLINLSTLGTKKTYPTTIKEEAILGTS